MTQKNRFPIIGRRDALGLMAATIVADTVWTGPLQACGLSGGPTIGAVTEAGAVAGLDGTPDLAGLTADHFEPLVGQSFMVGDQAMTLRKVRRGLSSGPQFREQFGIILDAPQDLPLQSEVLPLSHPALGRYDVLVSPADVPGAAVLDVCFA
jgi:hypothetical protein